VEPPGFVVVMNGWYRIYNLVIELSGGPLRTGRESFPSPSSSPSNASLEETRFRNEKTLAMNLVAALGMKLNAVGGTYGTTFYTGDAAMMGQPMPERIIGAAGPAGSKDSRVNSTGRARSPETARSAAVGDASWRGTRHGLAYVLGIKLPVA
jgi:hypothetical protein